MSKIYEAYKEQKEIELSLSEIEFMYPFQSEKEYLDALIRYTHPLHNRAMAIRNERMKMKGAMVYDKENLPNEEDIKIDSDKYEKYYIR